MQSEFLVSIKRNISCGGGFKEDGQLFLICEVEAMIHQFATNALVTGFHTDHPSVPVRLLAHDGRVPTIEEAHNFEIETEETAPAQPKGCGQHACADHAAQGHIGRLQ